MDKDSVCMFPDADPLTRLTKSGPLRTMLSRPYNNPSFANVGGGAGPSLLLLPPLSLIDQN